MDLDNRIIIWNLYCTSYNGPILLQSRRFYGHCKRCLTRTYSTVATVNCQQAIRVIRWLLNTARIKIFNRRNVWYCHRNLNHEWESLTFYCDICLLELHSRISHRNSWPHMTTKMSKRQLNIPMPISASLEFNWIRPTQATISMTHHPVRRQITVRLLNAFAQDSSRTTTRQLRIIIWVHLSSWKIHHKTRSAAKHSKGCLWL